MSGKSRTRKPGSLEGAFAAPPAPRRGEGLAQFLQRPTASPEKDPPAKPDAEEKSSATTPIADASAAAPESAGESLVPPVTKLVPAPATAAPIQVAQPADSDPQGSTSEDIEDVPVYIDAATLKALKAEKGRIGGTYADVAEEALEEKLQEVAVLLRSPTKSVGAVPRRRKKPKVRGGIQIQVRFSREQRDWLDRKKDELGAPTRSIIVALALQLKLGTLSD